MTSKKQLKARIRARMAKTGESYTTARRHILAGSAGSAGSAGGAAAGTAHAAPGMVGTAGEAGTETVRDHGYLLRGGLHPETSAVANVLAHGGVNAEHSGDPLSEALLFGIGGGPGAGYILWEFAAHGRVLTLGFRNQWQYTARWMDKTLARIELPLDARFTSGAKGAAEQLAGELASGRPCIIHPDRYHLGYWLLPDHLNGHGGHLVVAYAADADGIHVDDRNLAPLTVSPEAMEAARGRVPSYKNARYVLDAGDGGVITEATVRAAVRAGLAECVEHLSASSASFSLPAWRKWARMMTDPKAAKGWPKAFADRTGLVGVLLSTWEGAEAIGATGGNLRGLYADFLDEAAALLDDDRIGACAADFRAAAGLWSRLAETALPYDVPEFRRLRECTSSVRTSLTGEGDSGRAEAAEAAGELWRLRAELDRRPPDLDVDGLFGRMADVLTEIHATETAAVRRLGELMA